MRQLSTLVILATSLLAPAGCAGGTDGAPATSTPTAPTGTVPAPVTINIVGISGSGAFTPNPVQASAGSRIVWTNGTSATHHIVMDDGSADFGTIAPGASSTAMPVPGGGGTYHCTTHPSMVGSINGAIPASPTDPTDY